jgi:hypothetical protein
MGSITMIIDVRSDTPEVWEALSDFGALHERLVPNSKTQRIGPGRQTPPKRGR